MVDDTDPVTRKETDMAYGWGHCKGTKVERKPQSRSLERLRKMGAEIEAKLAKMTLTQLVGSK